MISLFRPKPPLASVDYNGIISASSFGNIPLHTVPLGELRITSGRLVACDPLAAPESKPFTFRIPKGHYPLSLIVAEHKEWGDRVALAVLTLRDEIPTRYELAVTPDQDVRTLKNDDEYFGFGVDAGMAALMDAQAHAAYLSFLEQFDATYGTSRNIYDDYFAERLKVASGSAVYSRPEGDWLNWNVPDTGGKNLIMFASGFGDGYYPVYTGKNAKGDIVNVVIDLLVLSSGDE